MLHLYKMLFDNAYNLLCRVGLEMHPGYLGVEEWESLVCQIQGV